MDAVAHLVAGLIASPAHDPATISLTVFGSLIPDITLLSGRKEHPDSLYRTLHSLVPCAVIGILCLPLALGLLSHVLVDVFTHSPRWAPRLFYPFNDFHLTYFSEWEFFSEAWMACWIVLLLILCLKVCL